MLPAVLLVVAGFLVAFLPPLFGWADAPAWIPFLLMGTGALWGAIHWWKRRRRLVVAIILLLAVGGQSVWYFHLAKYEPPVGAPAVGAKAPLFSAVRVRDGATFRLGAQEGRAALLVFYRGPW